MKQIFDWLREQFEEKSVQGFDGNGNPVNVRFVASIMAGDIITEAEANWESECCEWKGFDNSITKGKIEWTYKITCQSQPRYIPEDYTDSLWTRCPYCGKPIKISEVE